MYKLSYHAQVERAERIVYLMTEIGLGEELLTIVDNGKRVRMFDTGVVLVLSLDEDVVVTGYLASMEKAIAMWCRCYNTDAIPQHILRPIIKANFKHAIAINAINAIYKKMEKRG